MDIVEGQVAHGPTEIRLDATGMALRERRLKRIGSESTRRRALLSEWPRRSGCVCMHVCVCVCMHICIYTCVCVCQAVYVCMHECMYVCVHKCSLSQYEAGYACIYVCMCVCMHASSI